MGDYMRSLEKLIGRGDAILYPTHGSPISSPDNFLHAYFIHRRMREAQIAGLLARGYETIPDMVAKLYAGLSPALTHAAALTVEAHLEHLMEKGKASRQGEHYRPTAP
jgi:glyoxylase-like metal-dependent hydrolase (beta-lactamase superfamily II)